MDNKKGSKWGEWYNTGTLLSQFISTNLTMYNNNLVDVVGGSLSGVWGGVTAFIPKFVVALIIFIIGWIVGTILGRVVAQFIRAIKLDQMLKSVGTEDVMDKAGFKLDTGAFFGTLVKWFFVVVFLVAAVNVLGLDQVNIFLQTVVLGFLPNVIVAAIILVVGALVAHTIQRLVVGGAKAAMVPSANFAGGIAKWAVWIFAILAALAQLGIAGAFAQTLFTGLVAMLAIAGGLAFGLGGKEAAARYLEGLRKDIN